MSVCRNTLHSFPSNIQLSPRDRERIGSLAREKDPEICKQGLLNLARSLGVEDKKVTSFGLAFESGLSNWIRETTSPKSVLAFLALGILMRGRFPGRSGIASGTRKKFFPEWVLPRHSWQAAGVGRGLGPLRAQDFRGLFHSPPRMAATKVYSYSQDRMWQRVFDKNRDLPDIARTINGSYLTGKVQDLELAERFVIFYRHLPYFRHPGALAKAAQESLDYRMAMIRGDELVRLPQILQFLRWRQTSPWMASLQSDYQEGRVEILVKLREELELNYSHPSYSLFIPPNHSPSRRPQLWIREIPFFAEPEEKARHLLKRASDLVHEYEHFRHYRELDMRRPEQKLRAEMRSWLEEYLFRMQHGDLGFFQESRFDNPRDFGMYFRRWVEDLYLRKW